MHVFHFSRLKSYQNELEGLGKKERKEKEKEIYQSESVITRKLREKIMKKDFHSVKLIGRGAFGEVRSPDSFAATSKKFPVSCRSETTLRPYL